MSILFTSSSQSCSSSQSKLALLPTLHSNCQRPKISILHNQSSTSSITYNGDWTCNHLNRSHIFFNFWAMKFTNKDYGMGEIRQWERSDLNYEACAATNQCSRGSSEFQFLRGPIKADHCRDIGPCPSKQIRPQSIVQWLSSDYQRQVQGLRGCQPCNPSKGTRVMENERYKNATSTRNKTRNPITSNAANRSAKVNGSHSDTIDRAGTRWYQKKTKQEWFIDIPASHVDIQPCTSWTSCNTNSANGISLAWLSSTIVRLSSNEASYIRTRDHTFLMGRLLLLKGQNMTVLGGETKVWMMLMNKMSA